MNANMRMLPFLTGMAIALILHCDKKEVAGPNNNTPVCRITTPQENVVISKSDVVGITVDATDSDGTIQHVLFVIDDELVFWDTESPYAYSWDTSYEDIGPHRIKAIATDDDDEEAVDEIDVVLGYVYSPPENTEDGWQTTSLESVGLFHSYFENLMDALHSRENHLTHGILVARHGQLVFEEYFNGYRRDDQNTLIRFDRDEIHDQASSSKSFTSALLGIAIEKGFIRDVDQPVYEFFPEFDWLSTGPKTAITLKHMINMGSGLQWDQASYPPLDPRNDLILFATSQIPWYWYLSRPLVDTPGEMMNYSEASINVVGECIRRASGMRLDHFCDEYLFEAMGITNRRWGVKSNGWVWASGDLFIRPRDMLKFGQLYLQGGVWDGEQLVPREWADTASEPYFIFDDSFMAHERYWAAVADMDGYSHAWWTLEAGTYREGAFTASGWGDQRIMVLRELDMVVVFTGGSQWEAPFMTSHEMMVNYILPAVR